jgi:hypothetical protein
LFSLQFSLQFSLFIPSEPFHLPHFHSRPLPDSLPSPVTRHCTNHNNNIIIIMPPKKDASAAGEALLAGFTDKETKLIAAASVSSIGPDKVSTSSTLTL